MEIHSSGKSCSLSRFPDFVIVSGIESPIELSSGKRALCKSHLIGTIALEAYRHNTCVLIGRCRNKLSPVRSAFTHGARGRTCVTGLTEAAIAHDLEELVRRRIFTALARSLTSRTSAYVRLRSTELCRHSATCFNAISRKR